MVRLGLLLAVGCLFCGNLPRLREEKLRVAVAYVLNVVHVPYNQVRTG